MKKALINHKSNDPREYCRTCSHADWLHVKTYYYACGRKPRSYHEAQYASEICPCKEFLPEDNLAYLEQLEKRSHTNETPQS